MPTDLLLLVAFICGTSFGLILSVGIDELIDYQLEKEKEQMNFKIDKVTWLSKNDKE
jgi:hypothetical protein